MFYQYLRSSFEFSWMWIFPRIKLSRYSCSMRGKLGWRILLLLIKHKSLSFPAKLTLTNFGEFLSPALFLLYINDLPDDAICNIAIYADDTTLFPKCNRTSELESDLWDIADWGRKWLVDFSDKKTQLTSFGWSNNSVLVLLI